MKICVAAVNCSCCFDALELAQIAASRRAVFNRFLTPPCHDVATSKIKLGPPLMQSRRQGRSFDGFTYSSEQASGITTWGDNFTNTSRPDAGMPGTRMLAFVGGERTTRRRGPVGLSQEFGPDLPEEVKLTTKNFFCVSVRASVRNLGLRLKRFPRSCRA